MNDSKSFGGSVAVLNLTESTGGAESFTLKVGDHPYIKKNSDVNFGDGYIVDAFTLNSAVKCREAIPQADMDLAIVKKIAARGAKHPALANEVKDIIKAQWRI